MAESFKKSTYYASVGISPVSNRCGICIDTIQPGVTFQPQNDRKYVVKTIFCFSAAKKAPFSTIIATLKQSHIYPNDQPAQFLPQYNPDNKHYTDLNIAHYDTICALLQKIIKGLDIAYIDGKFTTTFTKQLIPDDEFSQRLRDESPKLTLSDLGVLILTPESTSIHSFNISAAR
jgi:hypothetical protein